MFDVFNIKLGPHRFIKAKHFNKKSTDTEKNREKKIIIFHETEGGMVHRKKCDKIRHWVLGTIINILCCGMRVQAVHGLLAMPMPVS